MAFLMIVHGFGNLMIVHMLSPWVFLMMASDPSGGVLALHRRHSMYRGGKDLPLTINNSKRSLEVMVAITLGDFYVLVQICLPPSRHELNVFTSKFNKLCSRWLFLGHHLSLRNRSLGLSSDLTSYEHMI